MTAGLITMTAGDPRLLPGIRAAVMLEGPCLKYPPHKPHAGPRDWLPLLLFKL